MEGLQGLDKLRNALSTLKDKSDKKIAKAGINAGLGELLKAMRRDVQNCSGASARMKTAARATLGKRLLRKAGEQYVGKAGFGVGKPTKGKKQKAAERAGDKTKRGIGLAAANIHWAVLGTQRRHTGEKTTRIYVISQKKYRTYQKFTGNPLHFTGAMPDVLAGVIKHATAGAGPQMLAAARQKVLTVLASEAATARKG